MRGVNSYCSPYLLVEIVHQPLRAIAKQAHHRRQPLLVERGHDCPPPNLPGDRVRRYQSFAHDVFENFRQNTFVVPAMSTSIQLNVKERELPSWPIEIALFRIGTGVSASARTWNCCRAKYVWRQRVRRPQ